MTAEDMLSAWYMKVQVFYQVLVWVKDRDECAGCCGRKEETYTVVVLLAMANKRTVVGPGKGRSKEAVQQGRCPLIRWEEDATHTFL
jgi:hypothetical protein